MSASLHFMCNWKAWEGVDIVIESDIVLKTILAITWSLCRRQATRNGKTTRRLEVVHWVVQVWVVWHEFRRQRGEGENGRTEKQ